MTIQLRELEPGAMVNLADRPGKTYQVVNVDRFSDCVWVRSWPLRSERRPTFAVPLTQVIRTPGLLAAG
jgi:hypothetical protein